MNESTFSKETEPKNRQDIRLHWLLQITKAINYNLSAQQLFEIYHSVLHDHLKIGRMLLLTHDVEWKITSHYGVEPELPLPDPNELLAMVPLFSGNKSERSAWMEQFETIVPVSHHDKQLAFVFLGDLDSNALKSKREVVTYIHTITNVIAVAIENKRMTRESIERAAMERELQLAAEMQSMLFPERLDTHGFLDVAATYIPHSSVGGDYYDFIPLGDHEALICMADVSGKGLSAALLMSNFQANLHALIRHTDFSLEQLVTELNTCVNRSARGEKYITFFVARINGATNQIEYVNAGHNPPLLVHGHEINVLDKGTTGLGMFDELPFLNHGVVAFPRNSLLCCYTDGITELENSEGIIFGTEGLSRLLLGHQRFQTMDHLHGTLIESLDEFRQGSPYADDVTLLSLRFIGGS